MSAPIVPPVAPVVRRSAPRRATSAVLTLGVATAAAAFAVSMVLEVGGVAAGAGDMTDIVGIVRGMVDLTPWSWAAAGTYAVVVTPVAGLLVTAWEYRSVGDRRTVLLALAVLAVLALSVVVAILR